MSDDIQAGGEEGRTGERPTDERRVVRKEPPVKEGKEQAWLFLRTLSGMLLVAWLLPAMFAPPEPFTFFLWLVPSWSAGILVALWLVYRNGYDRVRESPLYAPGYAPSRALTLFVATTLALKLVFTVGANVALGQRAYAVDVVFSAVALAAAYVLVYQGVLARAASAHDSSG